MQQNRLSENKPFFQNRFLHFSILSILLLFLYWEPVSNAPILNFDDRQLLIPMSDVRSLSDYSALWQANLILDIQPVRDLSYFLEYRMADLLGIRIHPQAFNLLLWISVCFIAFEIFKILGFTELEAGIGTVFLSIHPAAVNSIAWASGRKHVLSLFFISIASWLWLRWLNSEKKTFSFSALISYILSCISQPINAGWFIWAGLSALLQKDGTEKRTLLRKSAVPIILCAAAGLITVSLNLWYYSSSRYSLNPGGKFADEGFSALPNRFFIFGRFLFQLLIPFRPSITSYDPSSWLSVLGILIFPFFLYAVWKQNENKKPVYVWGAFVLLPLLTVNGPSNQHFGWDTYLLTPLLGWSAVLGFTLKNFFEKYKISQNILWIFFLLLFCAFSFSTKKAADSWKNDESLWKRAVETESSSAALAGFIKTSLSMQKNVHDLWPLALELQKKLPNDYDLPYIFGRIIFEDPKLNQNEKRELFERHSMKGPWFIYYRSAFDASTGSFSDADRRMTDLFQNDTKRTALHFRDRLSEVAASWYAMCTFAKNSTCQENVRRIRESVPAGRWNEAEFNKRISSFRLAPVKSE